MWVSVDGLVERDTTSKQAFKYALIKANVPNELCYVCVRQYCRKIHTSALLYLLLPLLLQTHLNTVRPHARTHALAAYSEQAIQMQRHRDHCFNERGSLPLTKESREWSRRYAGCLSAQRHRHLHNNHRTGRYVTRRPHHTYTKKERHPAPAQTVAFYKQTNKSRFLYESLGNFNEDLTQHS